MTPEQYVYKTKPPYVYLVIYLLSAGFFCFIGSLVMPMFKNAAHAHDQSSEIITGIILGGFLFFVLCSLWLILAFKICYLTSTELVITRPLLSWKRTVLFTEIERTFHKDNKIDISRSAFTRDWVKVGETVKLQLKSGSIIRVSSMETSGYQTFIKKLETQIRKSK
ncbi:hypothetical protein [Mucilaginibacter ginsenosidivorans]|uniref:Uncharacterized protein n=1 Tax=Mucilaginibacter ginsenosidivorans TaxID=398053 RepID=A0A5B8URK6_9SPHI|nr:hypothetical protein [Mucilaginibacter ginsenosidivorans]QEC61707.1 hypothetical protein FRZ54_03610 [Mucilaginibacter ginsenosidivorans]